MHFGKSQTHPPTHRLFFLDLFIEVRFWAFLGEFKNITINIGCTSFFNTEKWRGGGSEFELVGNRL
jgi:hypothetical protein